MCVAQSLPVRAGVAGCARPPANPCGRERCAAARRLVRRVRTLCRHGADGHAAERLLPVRSCLACLGVRRRSSCCHHRFALRIVSTIRWWSASQALVRAAPACVHSVGALRCARVVRSRCNLRDSAFLRCRVRRLRSDGSPGSAIAQSRSLGCWMYGGDLVAPVRSSAS